jgi:titin
MIVHKDDHVTFELVDQPFVFILLGPPSPPQQVAIPDASRLHINVTWKPPTKDGGCPITGYHVEVAEARPELKWLRVNTRPIKELEFRVDDGIKPEKKYVIRVRAINSIGVSDPSEITDKIFTKDPDCTYNRLHS